MDSVAAASGFTTTSLSQNLQDAQKQASGVLLEREREAGLAAIERATTGDANPKPLRAIPGSMNLLGMARAEGESPVVVASFALRGDGLTSVTVPGAEGQVGYLVHVHLSAANLSTGARFDLDTVRRFLAPPLSAVQYLVGVTELDLPAGHYAVTAEVSQGDVQGIRWSLRDVAVPGPTDDLALSDLALGREGSGARWSSGTADVALNPLNTFTKGEEAEIYSQLRGLRPGHRYATRLAFFSTADPPTHAARLSIGASFTARAPWQELQQKLGLRNLEPGHYRVVLTVSGTGVIAEAVAWLIVLK